MRKRQKTSPLTAACGGWEGGAGNALAAAVAMAGGGVSVFADESKEPDFDMSAVVEDDAHTLHHR
eukprot:4605216-Prymnesium_polylepis.1